MDEATSALDEQTENTVLQRLKELCLELLQQQDQRLTLHDFRMVKGTGHTNLIFDIALPAELMDRQKQIKAKLDGQLQLLVDGDLFKVTVYLPRM